jgi:hypothetical protein
MTGYSRESCGSTAWSLALANAEQRARLMQAAGRRQREQLGRFTMKPASKDDARLG